MNESCFAPGIELPILNLRGARVGIGICADARDRVDSATLALSKPDVVLYPLNKMLPKVTAEQWRDRHVQILLERAGDTGAVVISADVFGEQQNAVAYGCSAVALPDGTVAGQVPSSASGGLIFDVDLRER